MLISDALNDLKLIEKKILKNTELIQKYSSEVIIGSSLPTFKTEDAQKREVAALVQSVEDLTVRRGAVRRALALTNATVLVKIGDVEQSITEWIEFRLKGAAYLTNAYNALNSMTSQRQTAGQKIDISQGVRAVLFYDEAEKNKKLAEVAEVFGEINKRLENVNATTLVIGM